MGLRTYFRPEVNYIFKRVNAERLVIRKPFLILEVTLFGKMCLNHVFVYYFKV